MTTALSQIYASAPAGAYAIYTLEITNEAWDAPLRFVQGFEDLIATIETSEEVTFTRSGIGMQLPKRGVQGREDLEFQLDNVSGEAIAAIQAARSAGTITRVILRVYASDDLSAPAQSPVELIVVGARVNIRSVSVLATFRDFINKAWPRRRYTIELAPGLKHVNGL